MRYILDILSWKPSLASQKETRRSRVWVRVRGWREVFYNNNLKSRNNKCCHLWNIHSVPMLSYLLSNLIHKGLWKVWSSPCYRWGRGGPKQAYGPSSEPLCHTAPCCHLLSARILGKKLVLKTFQGACKVSSWTCVSPLAKWRRRSHEVGISAICQLYCHWSASHTHIHTKKCIAYLPVHNFPIFFLDFFN